MHNYACIECAICVNWPNFYCPLMTEVDLISELHWNAPPPHLNAIYRTYNPNHFDTWATFLFRWPFFPLPPTYTISHARTHTHIPSHPPVVCVANASQSIRYPLSSLHVLAVLDVQCGNSVSNLFDTCQTRRLNFMKQTPSLANNTRNNNK